jgi:catechol 2,3-dioxygenase-like lactoylglutathione lyase family enzyme
MRHGATRPRWLSMAGVVGRKCLSVLSLTVLCAASAAEAQLAVPNAAGVSMGHLHYHVSDVAANKNFWIAMGGVPGRFGTTEMVKLPDLLIFLTRAEATGTTVGSAVSHVAFKSKNLDHLKADLTAAGAKYDANYVLTPTGDRLELFQELSGANVKFTPDSGHGDAAAHRHSLPMSGSIGTHHLHIYVPEGEAEKGRDWYVRMFGGVPGIRGTNNYKAVDLPGMNINFLGDPGFKMQKPIKGTTMDHIGFEVVNLEAFCKALEAKGVTLDVPYGKRGGLASAFLTDPWGTYIELTEGLKDL